MTRRISWIRVAEKDFKKFPITVQDQMKNALDIAAFGRKADIAKPLKGFGSGIWGLLNISRQRPIPGRNNSAIISWRECSKKSVQQGRSRFDARSVLSVREHGKMARTPLAAFFNIPIFENALPYQTNASRAIYAVQLDEDIWVLHAFQKKSKTGIKTPKQDIDLVKERLKRLKEMLK